MIDVGWVFCAKGDTGNEERRAGKEGQGKKGRERRADICFAGDQRERGKEFAILMFLSFYLMVRESMKSLLLGFSVSSGSTL